VSGDKTAEKLKPHVRINTDWCKGCGLCAAVCPKKILRLGGFDQKAEVVDESLCINCKMCEIHCPDFAITIEED